MANTRGAYSRTREVGHIRFIDGQVDVESGGGKLCDPARARGEIDTAEHRGQRR